MEITYVFCDNCNLKRNITANASGVFWGVSEDAVKNAGWEVRNFGHCCPECAEKLDSIESTNTLVGREALADTWAGILDENRNKVDT